MHDVSSFEIEEGSCLESIEYKGFDGIGFSIRSESSRSGILVLPSTVTSIAEHGLFYNNLIKTKYYCGSTHLSNSSELVNGVSVPDFKVTSSYSYDTIFRDYTPKNDSSSIAEAEEVCKSFGHDLTKNYNSVPVKGGRLVTGWSDDNRSCPPRLTSMWCWLVCRSSPSTSLPLSIAKTRELFHSRSPLK